MSIVVFCPGNGYVKTDVLPSSEGAWKLVVFTDDASEAKEYNWTSVIPVMATLRKLGLDPKTMPVGELDLEPEEEEPDHLRYFAYDHLPERVQAIPKQFFILADVMDDYVGFDHPQAQAGLQKLLEAKDCFVRAGLD